MTRIAMKEGTYDIALLDEVAESNQVPLVRGNAEGMDTIKVGFVRSAT